jgi:hypothetical protein
MKKFISIIFFFAVGVRILISQTAIAPTEGIGTVQSPYQIATLENLYWVSQSNERWNKHYIQIANIDASETCYWFNNAGWQPIGNSNVKFSGSYDGQDFSIIHLHINRPGSSEVGLFGVAGGISTQVVTIKNIKLPEANVTGNREVGILVGLADQWNEITNCHVSGQIKGNRNIGGLIGWIRRTQVLNSSAVIDVSMVNPAGALYHGGLIGHANSTSTIKQSHAIANVSGRSRVGGLMGAIGWNSIVEDSYAHGNVSSDIINPMIGGLIGEVWNAGVRRSYSTTKINMQGITSDFGGLVGNKTTSSNYFDEGNFWDKQKSGLNISVMGIGKNTAEMKNQATFINASWDLEKIWSINTDANDGYIHLQWQRFFETINIWIGNNNSDWNNPNNWSLGILPDGKRDVVISNSNNKPEITNPKLNVAMCKNLILEQGSSLIIHANSALTVGGNIENNGIIEIKSTQNGDGSIIIMGEKTGNGIYKIDRYYTGLAWHMISSPVTNAGAGVFSGSWLREYNEPTNSWGNFLSSTTAPLHQGKGYIVWSNNSSEIRTYQGNINHGTISLPVQYTNNPQLTVLEKGWNLVGNPYPSSIEWNGGNGWEMQNISPTIYIFDPSPGHGNYVIWNYGSQASAIPPFGTAESGKIAMGQSFFVQTTAALPSLSINHNAKIHDDIPFRSQSSGTISIEVKGNSYSDKVLIYHTPNASDEFNAMFDAVKLPGFSEAPQLYTRKQNEKVAVHTVNSIDKTEGEIIYLETRSNGKYSLKFSHTLSEDATPIIYDRVAKEYITPNTYYTFVSNRHDRTDRFEIVLRSSTNLEDNQIFASNPAHIWENDNTLHIENVNNNNVTVFIYNVVGSLVLQSASTQTDLRALPKGTYIVHVLADNSVQMKKIVIQ